MSELTKEKQGKRKRGLVKSFQSIGKDFHACLKTVREAELSIRASSLTYTTVLSIAPLIAVLFYIFKIFGGFDYAYSRLEPFLIENLSEGTGEIVAQTLASFIKNVHAKAVGWVGIAGLVFTAMTTYLTVTEAFRKIWIDVPLRRLYNRIGRGLIVFTFGPILAVLSIALTTAVAARIKNIPYTGSLITWTLNLILYTMVYWELIPERIPLKTIIKGALLPSIGFELAKLGYAVYTKKFLDYSKFYGSFAAIPMFLFWVYIAWFITLFGAAWIKTLHLKQVQLKHEKKPSVA